MHEKLKNTALVALVIVSAALGGAAIAGAAGGSSSSSNAAAATTQSSPAQPPGPRGGMPPRRSDETPLSGETASKVRDAALAEVAGATIERLETDGDGHALYEAHVVKSDGTRATVYVDASFDVVSVESGRP